MSVRVGVIGVGNIGQEHIRRLTRAVSGAQVVGLADVDTARAEAVASAIPGARVYGTGQDLIRAQDVDGVVVATCGPTHEEYVLAAIQADKPVFCENTLVPTVDECLRILDAEIAHARRLVQAHCWTGLPATCALPVRKSLVRCCRSSGVVDRFFTENKVEAVRWFSRPEAAAAVDVTEAGA